MSAINKNEIYPTLDTPSATYHTESSESVLVASYGLQVYGGRLGNELRRAAKFKTRVNPKAKELVCKTGISTSPKDVQKGLFFSIVI